MTFVKKEDLTIDCSFLTSNTKCPSVSWSVYDEQPPGVLSLSSVLAENWVDPGTQGGATNISFFKRNPFGGLLQARKLKHGENTDGRWIDFSIFLLQFRKGHSRHNVHRSITPTQVPISEDWDAIVIFPIHSGARSKSDPLVDIHKQLLKIKR